MAKHRVGTRDEWLKARLELLNAEKELTRQSDELARRRQELPWVEVDKTYRFQTDDGQATLAELFRGRSQLLMYHFMFGPDYKAGCPSCSSIADGFNGVATHLAGHDVMFWAVSRAPLPQLQVYKKRLGWSFPWASSHGSDFNFDFHVSFTEDEQRKGLEFNYQREPPIETSPGIASRTTADGPEVFARMTGTDVPTYARERMGISAFVREDDKLYHTYSTYSRGVDIIWSVYQWLDRAPKGRNETGVWLRRRDEYDQR